MPALANKSKNFEFELFSELLFSYSNGVSVIHTLLKKNRFSLYKTMRSQRLLQGCHSRIFIQYWLARPASASGLDVTYLYVTRF